MALPPNFLRLATLGPLVVLIFFLMTCQTSDQQSKQNTDTLDVLPTEMSVEKMLWNAQSFMDEQRYLDAVKILTEVIRRDSLNRVAYHLLADAYLDGLESRKALETMEQAGEIFPDSIPTLLKLSEFQLILRQYKAALQTLERIHQLQPAQADAYFMKGMVRKELGDTSGSLLQFQYATREDPQLLDAWINAGQLSAAVGKEDAPAYFEAALRIMPHHIPTLQAYAQMRAEQQEFEHAIELYTQIIKLDTDHSASYFDLGLLFLDLDSISKARDHFNMAVATDPGYGRAYFYRGLTSELQGDQNKALADYQQALQIDPEDQDAQEGVQRLNSSK